MQISAIWGDGGLGGSPPQGNVRATVRSGAVKFTGDDRLCD